MSRINELFGNSNSGSLAGHLAIATPELDASEFRRSVVLIIQHTEEGAFGVVLNRPPNDEVKQAWESMTGNVNDSQRNISLGGPVNGPVFALHELKSLGEQKVQCGLFFSATPQNLQKLASQATSGYRVFFGAAGWAKGQLEHEVGEGIWVTCPATTGIVFANAATQWEMALRHYGRFVWRSLGIKQFPDSPLLN